VTCWFCHQVEAIEGTHNNPLVLALDGVMRGSVSDPLAPDAHGVDHGEAFDRNRMDSSAMIELVHVREHILDPVHHHVHEPIHG
jgi:hypothetical protein